MKINMRLLIINAFDNILATKLRSFLALLGIVVGTAAIIALVSIGQLATLQVLKQYEDIGTDLISINFVTLPQIGEGRKILATKITVPLITKIEQELVGIKEVAPYILLITFNSYKGHEISAMTIGTSDCFKHIAKLELQKGRFISQLDRFSFNCTIGKDIYDELKKYTNEPLGTKISIENHIFTIVGVLKSKIRNPFIHVNSNEAIFIPLQAAFLLQQNASIRQVVLKISQSINSKQVIASLIDYFNRNNISEVPYFFDSEQFIQTKIKQQQILTAFMAIIAAISLFVGGIGVMNIMLANVNSRIHEIGVRRAIGATRFDILILFFLETLILSMLGGLFGIFFGLLLSFIVAEIKLWEFYFLLCPPILGFMAAIITGIFFGVYPAYKASKVDPVIALRAE